MMMLSRQRAAISSARPSSGETVPSCDEVGEIHHLPREFSDRDAGPFRLKRRNDDVDAAAVGQPRVQHRAEFVDAPADRRGDALRDMQDMGVVAKLQLGQFQLAAALDIDHARAVDQDVGDAVVAQQRLERPEPTMSSTISARAALLVLIDEQAAARWRSWRRLDRRASAARPASCARRSPARCA